MSNDSTRRQYRNEKWLREQCVENLRSMPDIAEECDCAARTDSIWLNRYRIETRNRGCPGAGGDDA